MKAVRVHKPGGPEGMVYEDVPDPKAGAGQAVIKVEAIGLNFAEVNQRRNANPASLPMPIGGEAAGTVVEFGPGVAQFKVGDRVAFNGVPGAYAEKVAAPAARLVRVPDHMTTKQAAASDLQGMTAHYLACSTYPLSTKGCLYLTRVNLGTYTATRPELEERSGDIFRWVGSGQLKVHVFGEYPLAEAAKAQAALEHRATIGKVLLVP